MGDRPSGWWPCLAFLAACGGAKPAPVSVGTDNRADDRSPRLAPAPLLLPGADATAPAWVEPDLPTGIDDPIDEQNIVAWGAKSALLATKAGTFAVHLTAGAAGPLTLPVGSAWLGIGGKGDRLYAALEDGTLFAADDPRKGFTQVGRVPGAVAWAASMPLIAAAVGDQVMVSTDGGKKFRGHRVAKGFATQELFARSDGVIVAFGNVVDGDAPLTYVSRGGAKWRKSSLQPTEIVQEGDWIRSDCMEAVMAAKSLDWVNKPEDPLANPPGIGHDELASWDDGSIPTWTTQEPSPPPYRKAARVVGQGGTCGIDYGVSASSSYAAKVVCAGAFSCEAREHGALPVPTRSALHIIDDGACPVDGDNQCTGPATRVPHLLRFDRADGTARVVDAPDGCTPARTYAARGLLLLVCAPAGDTAAIFARTGDGWQAEGTISDPPAVLGALNLAADGAVAIFTDCEARAGCRVWVRAGDAPGSGHWSGVVIPEAEVLRVLPGGAVVGLVPEGALSGTFSVVLAGAGGDNQILLRGVAIDHADTVEIVDGQIRIDSARSIATDGSLL